MKRKIDHKKEASAKRIQHIISRLRCATADMEEPGVIQIINEYGKNSFLILISCLLSLRTKDVTSIQVAKKLFDYAQTPQELLNLSKKRLEEIIRPIGFYRQKAKTLRDVSRVLVDSFGGRVPCTEQELLSIKGIGLKTASLVLGEAFGVPAICVDTHVHRISNRLGLVATKTPKQTEQELKRILPKKNWIEFNRLLVMWGQNVCTPISPFCSRCQIKPWCSKVGVKTSR